MRDATKDLEGLAFSLEDGSYFDGDEMLHAPDGSLLPDGVYIRSNGEVFMYEGNHAAWLKEMGLCP